MRLDRPGLLFALIGLAGLIRPFAEFKPNRILPGEGLSLAASLPWGMAVTAVLAVVFAVGVLRPSPLLRLLAASGALMAVVLALGAAARHLTPEGDTLARVSPGSGFWLLMLALVLMLADAIARLRPSLRLRWLLLAVAVAVVAGVLASGVLDQVSIMREYAVRRALFLREARAHLVLAFGSLGLAVLVGLPVGVLLYQARGFRGPVLSVLNILQTIPSLALFGIMIPIFGWIAATVPGAAQAGVSGIGIFPGTGGAVSLFAAAGRLEHADRPRRRQRRHARGGDGPRPHPPAASGLGADPAGAAGSAGGRPDRAGAEYRPCGHRRLDRRRRLRHVRLPGLEPDGHGSSSSGRPAHHRPGAGCGYCDGPCGGSHRPARKGAST